jgi:hypothetical protein
MPIMYHQAAVLQSTQKLFLDWQAGTPDATNHSSWQACTQLGEVQGRDNELRPDFCAAV